MNNAIEIEPSEQLTLKSVSKLFEYDFLIPEYQRGYRWTETEVKQLLIDIWEFSKREDKVKGEFYCLQPIVVKKNKLNVYEVIDGQQRLTTIFIILKYLEDICQLLNSNFSIYTITYSTRIESTNFLKNINKNSNEKNNDNIDNFHMYEAYETVVTWFENQENTSIKLDFLNTLIKSQLEDSLNLAIDIGNNVRVIWYEVNDKNESESIDIFTRLNIGKIPLTNSELIKALFLQKENFNKNEITLKQIQIASEWDLIERTLQNDSFWFFIYNPENNIKYDNRIEYIFDLMQNRRKESEYYHTFNRFNEDFFNSNNNNQPDIDQIWLEVKKYYFTFEEWYNDHKLFHYIGYLIDCNISIVNLKEKSSSMNKNSFEMYLKNKIKELINCSFDEIQTLEYGNANIKKVLLLFNIQTILKTQRSEMRFPFHKYKIDKWDIEHVSSQTDKTINGKQQLIWANDILDYFVGSNEKKKVKDFIDELDADSDKLIEILKNLIKIQKEEKIAEEEFHLVFKSLQEYFKENKRIEDKDNISNLTLLDSKTNRSYGNAFFPIKRKRIIENDSNGIFIPIATKNLFLKYYSKKLDEIMYWNNNDAKDYLNAITKTLKIYLTEDKTHESE